MTITLDMIKEAPRTTKKERKKKLCGLMKMVPVHFPALKIKYYVGQYFETCIRCMTISPVMSRIFLFLFQLFIHVPKYFIFPVMSKVFLFLVLRLMADDFLLFFCICKRFRFTILFSVFVLPFYYPHADIKSIDGRKLFNQSDRILHWCI